MYCPLCKAEYRQGVSNCSDCQIPLVHSQEEAAAVPVATVWEGGHRRIFELILQALGSAGIPSHGAESLERRPSSWIHTFLSVLPIFSAFVKSRPLTHFSVLVLETDLPRAQSALSQFYEARAANTKT